MAVCAVKRGSNVEVYGSDGGIVWGWDDGCDSVSSGGNTVTIDATSNRGTIYLVEFDENDRFKKMTGITSPRY